MTHETSPIPQDEPKASNNRMFEKPDLDRVLPDRKVESEGVKAIKGLFVMAIERMLEEKGPAYVQELFGDDENDEEDFEFVSEELDHEDAIVLSPNDYKFID